MNHQAKMQNLQKETVELLTASSALMGQVKNILGNGYQKQQELIEHEIRKISKSELLIGMIAPMKAGKSTVINAIIGMQLLPSHNKGMTVLPTEIELRHDITVPILTMTKGTKDILQTFAVNLKKTMKEKGKKWVDEQIEEYSYLEPLIENILNGKWDTLPNECKGQEQIATFLTGMNHIIRLCILMDIQVRGILSLQDYPRITAPFQPFANIAMSEAIGKLIIIDTPGADEDNTDPKVAAVLKEILYHVMSQQLEHSSVILTIVDFTTPNNIAATSILRDVKRMVAMRGAEHAYVLYNKYDNAKSGEQDLEQIRKDVGKKFKDTKFNSATQVFAISGLYALAARAFQVQQGNAQRLQPHAARLLFEARYGREEAESELEQADLESVKRLAEKTWRSSNFVKFLEPVIGQLMINALPFSMKSALTLTRNTLWRLSDDARIQREGLYVQANDLARMITLLEGQIKTIEEHRKTLGKVEQYKEILRRNTEEHLASSFRDTELPYAIKSFFGGETERVSYNKRDEFLHLKELIEGSAEEKIRETVDFALSQIKRQVEYTTRDIQVYLDENAKSIVEKMKETLEKTFKIELSPVRITFNPSDVSVSRSISFNYNAEKAAWWETALIAVGYWSWNREKFTISQDEFARQFRQKMSDNRDAIKRSVNAFISNNVDKAITTYFEQIDSYIETYKNSLRRSLENQKLDNQQKKALVEQLDTFIPNIGGLITSIDKSLTQVEILNK